MWKNQVKGKGGENEKKVSLHTVCFFEIPQVSICYPEIKAAYTGKVFNFKKTLFQDKETQTGGIQ